MADKVDGNSDMDEKEKLSTLPIKFFSADHNVVSFTDFSFNTEV